MNYDVIVVGAGPVGSHTACRLAELGYRTAVLERQPYVGHKLCCTGIIGRECYEFYSLDPSCVVREAKSARLFAPSGDYIRISRDQTQAYIVDRPYLDRSLAERALEQGAEYQLSSKVVDIAVSSDGVSLAIAGENDSNNIQGKVAVIASGFASPLPQMLGLGKINHLISGAQTEVLSDIIGETEVYFSHRTAPGFFAWAVPSSEDKVRVGLFAKKNPGVYLQKLINELTIEGKLKSSPKDISYGGIPLKPLRRTYDERVLVVGDAAGQVKPTTGGGIYYGLLSADHAVDTINEAFTRNDFSKKQFARYQKRWKATLGRELMIDYYARGLYNRFSDKQLDAIFTIVRDNAIAEDLLDSSYRSFDWHGELVLDGLKRLTPWSHLFTRYLPAYFLRMLRSAR